MNHKLLELAHAGFAVRRFHTVPVVVTTETVGHHTASVLAIIFAMYNESPPMALVRAALYHDIAEAITGDIPATAKWDFPALSGNLYAAEAEIAEAAGADFDLPLELAPVLKFADMMSLMYKAKMEVLSGNQGFIPIYENGLRYCTKLLENELRDNEAAIELFAYFTGGNRGSK